MLEPQQEQLYTKIKTPKFSFRPIHHMYATINKMDIDILNVAFDLTKVKPLEIEECLEDPYALRVLPDVEHGPKQTRYYLIGKTLAGRALFLSFVSNGKVARIIL